MNHLMNHLEDAQENQAILKLLNLEEFQNLPKKRKPTRVTSLFDINETQSHYLISFDMPTVLGNQVKVTLSDTELVLQGSGERGRPRRNPSISLKVNSTGQVITARYDNGILVLALPKETPQTQNLEFDEMEYLCQLA